MPLWMKAVHCLEQRAAEELVSTLEDSKVSPIPGGKLEYVITAGKVRPDFKFKLLQRLHLWQRLTAEVNWEISHTVFLQM